MSISGYYYSKIRIGLICALAIKRIIVLYYLDVLIVSVCRFAASIFKIDCFHHNCVFMAGIVRASAGSWRYRSRFGDYFYGVSFGACKMFCAKNRESRGRFAKIHAKE